MKKLFIFTACLLLSVSSLIALDSASENGVSLEFEVPVPVEDNTAAESAAGADNDGSMGETTVVSASETGQTLTEKVVVQAPVAFYDFVDDYLASHFDFSALDYTEKEAVASAVDNLSAKEKRSLYEKHSKSAAPYAWMNVLLGFGIGSFAQGDAAGGALAAIFDVTSKALFLGGFFTGGYWLAVLLNPVYLFSAFYSGATAVDSNTLEYYFGDFSLSSTGVACVVTLIGFVGMVVSVVVDCKMPGRFSTRKNTALKNLLGVQGASLSLTPVITTDSKLDGVNLALSLKI